MDDATTATSTLKPQGMPLVEHLLPTLRAGQAARMRGPDHRPRGALFIARPPPDWD